MKQSTKVLLVALGAGTLGAVASLMTAGPGPFLRTELGQRLLGEAISVSAPAPPAGVSVASRDQPIPAIELPGLDGQPTSLASLQAGRPMLVNVWASWCGPCIEEMPELQRFATAQGANGVQVVGIALDEVTNVRDFLSKVQVSYPILIDTAGPADAGVRLGNPKGVLPYSILVSADGILLKQRIGPFVHGEIDAWAQP